MQLNLELPEKNSFMESLLHRGGVKLRFIIPGEPKGKARHRTTKTGRTYTPKPTVDYENLIKQCYSSSCDKERLEGQIEAHVQAFFSIPKSTSKKKREQMLSGEIRPTKKPDWDNIGKVVCDALNELAYHDDSSIVDGIVRKYYSEEPRVEVELKKLITE
jgi:Holliday junction resolvase RusA-like endonuclease